jgi:signal transduction histidine kinase
MNFIIQDLLDYSQIKAGKFRLNYSTFNIRETIEKVMCMQSSKARDKGLNFGVKFKNINISEESLMIGESPLICCDEHRIM